MGLPRTKGGQTYLGLTLQAQDALAVWALHRNGKGSVADDPERLASAFHRGWVHKDGSGFRVSPRGLKTIRPMLERWP